MITFFVVQFCKMFKILIVLNVNSLVHFISHYYDKETKINHISIED